MKISLSAVAGAIASLGMAMSAQAQSSFDYKFSGFGSVGFVHSDNRGADYVTTRLQPNGAGLTRQTDWGPDTKLGGQMNLKFGDKLEAVVQVVSQHQGDNSFRPEVEWANLKYKFSDNFSVRVGRIALPPYMISETRQVGYSYTWAHPPVEVFSIMPITSNDGIDISWQTRLGEARNVLQVYYGTRKTEAASGTRVKSKQATGFSDTLELGSWTAHVSFFDAKVDFVSAQIEPLFAGLRQFAGAAGAVPVPGFQTAAASANALVKKYSTLDVHQSNVSVGLNYDPGDWFAMGEYVFGKAEGLQGDIKAWHLLAGYRIGSFTPYVGLASARSSFTLEKGIDVSGAPPLAAGAAALTAGIQAAQRGINPTQKSATVGVRWDAIRNVAIKLQYERAETGTGSSGYFAKPLPTFTGAKVNLVTAVVDFVF
ncbi:MAG: hypothetical protein HY855_18365 [Burkholderiales bacterium]|nr:hypothetical protein [Burkholderiales bacterium]